jgi:hypothetical protein
MEVNVTVSPATHLLPKSNVAVNVPAITVGQWLARWGGWLVFAVVALGIAVRLRHYWAAPSYWYDEAYLLVNIFEKSFAELAGPLRCEQAAPPLFLWTLRALYLLFGGSERVMRLPAFVASLSSILVMIPLAKRIAGRTGFIWATGFVALSQTGRFNANLVKPYALDLLATELVLLAGVVYAMPPRANRRRLAVLICLALVLPWWSYPSIFAIGGVSLALVAKSIWRQSRQALWAGIVVGLVGAASFSCVWLLVGQIQRSNFLTEYWQPFFFDVSSLWAAGQCVVVRLVKMGHYATTGMGIPLFAMTILGSAVLWRGRRSGLVLLWGTLAATFCASALRLYPLEDRLFCCAVPVLWLLASVGLDSLAIWPRGRWSIVVVPLLVAPLAEGIVTYGRWLAVVPSKVEFRDAFEYARDHGRDSDLWWVSHPEVFEVYYGSERRCLSGRMDQGALAGHQRRRIWIIAAMGSGEDAAVQQLSACGWQLQQRKDFATVAALLYELPDD